MTSRHVVVIRHKVANYRKWKAVFDARGPARAAHGCQSVRVFRRADNPKELVVMLTWSDLGKARQFVVSDDLKDMLTDAGVNNRVHDVYLLEEIEQTCDEPVVLRPEDSRIQSRPEDHHWHGGKHPSERSAS